MKNEKIIPMSHLNGAVPPEISIRFLLCGTTYPNKSYCIRTPAATLSRLEYVTDGVGYLHVNGERITLRAGDSYFLHEGDDHDYYADKNDPWTKIWVNFSGAHSMHLAKLYGIDGICVFRGVNISDLLQKIHHYAEVKDTEHAAEQCSALLSQAFIRLSRSLHVSPNAGQSPAQKMRQYIEQHAAEPITLEQMAAVCEKSPSQAERIFRTEMGIPLYRYALDCKLRVACQLLTETGMSVKEIAAFLSFGDEFYFSGLFRRKIGVSPARYRKSGGALENPIINDDLTTD